MEDRELEIARTEEESRAGARSDRGRVASWSSLGQKDLIAIGVLEIG